MHQAGGGGITVRGTGNVANHVVFDGLGRAVLQAVGELLVCDERGLAEGRAVSVDTSGHIAALAASATAAQSCTPR